MKLLFCKKCRCVFSLLAQEREKKCECGKCGDHENGVWGPHIIFELCDSSINLAVRLDGKKSGKIGINALTVLKKRKEREE